MQTFLTLFFAAFALQAVLSVPIDINTDISPYTILDQVAPLVSTFNSIFIVRTTAALSNAWFDATAFFDPKKTAVGYYTKPVTYLTGGNAEKNRAILYASRIVLNSVVPGTGGIAIIDNYLANALLLPFDGTITDLSTPEGVGILVGKAIVAQLENDASNQVGKLGPKRTLRRYNYAGNRYRGYTGFAPINSFENVVDPRHWVPYFASDGVGVFSDQEHVAPQWALLKTYTGIDVTDDLFVSPVPATLSYFPYDAHGKITKYIKNLQGLADQALSISANLNDQTKIQAEFYNDKPNSFVRAFIAVGKSRSLSLTEFVTTSFALSIAALDASIATWANKIKYQSARPITLIRTIYPDTNVTAWGGPKKGTVTDITGKDYVSYIKLPPHADYPSGSAVYFSAFARAAIAIYLDDKFNLTYVVNPGKSLVETGLTPINTVIIQALSFTQYEKQGGDARVLGGIHFAEDVTEAQRIGAIVGPLAVKKVNDLLAGINVVSYKVDADADGDSN